MKKEFYENKIEFELVKVHGKKSFNTPQDNVLHFGILRTKKSSTIGEKRKMQSEIVDTIPILGLQNFDNYSCLNPIEITINSNSITVTLPKYKRYKLDS